jgi:glycosyltransferase involved in cell wall biosynthesis
MRRPVDLLIVASGTTIGLRRADNVLRGALEELGISYVMAIPAFRVANRLLHRDMLVIDLAQAAELRLATSRALRRWRPRAVIFATTHAALLQPDRVWRRRCAIRFDSPAALTRPGRRFALEHLLERINFRLASVLTPSGVRVADALRPYLPAGTRVVSLPIPIEDAPNPPLGRSADGQRAVLVYAGSPARKGLDLAVAAWSVARRPGWRLVIAGIDSASGQAYLRSQNLEVPTDVTWLGALDPVEYRQHSAGADVFLAASRYEAFGLAQLEALADGSMLVTVPSKGPYEALQLARELDVRTVAPAIEARALARALDYALTRSDEERSRYSEGARVLVEPYREATLAARLRDDVLPILLG